jgi:hypothetical protein
MALNPIEQYQYNQDTAQKLKTAKQQFTDYKNALQSIFTGLQAVIDDGDTDPTWVAELVALKQQGKNSIQTMLNGIT